MEKEDNIEKLTKQELKIGSAVWKTRKRVIIGTMIFCACCIVYIMLQTNVIPVFETIVTGCFTLSGAALGFFIGGETYHDIKSEALKIKKDALNAVKQKITDNDES